MTLGQDGLVANTAKYAGAQPIVAVNPEPIRFDGILLPFLPDQARTAVGQVLDAKAAVREVTLADATLNDGQRLLAFNDLFLGARSHVSALYRIVCGKRSETQSSSGVLVSTGAGSTGWISSVFNMASGCDEFLRRATGQGHSHALGRSASVIRRSGAVYQPPLAGWHRGRHARSRRGTHSRIVDAFRRRDLFGWYGGGLSPIQLWGYCPRSRRRTTRTSCCIPRTFMKVAVDTVIFTIQSGELKVLLVKRKIPPSSGNTRIPGGFVRDDEDLDQAALRELKEETGVADVYLEQLYSFGDPRRDPRGAHHFRILFRLDLL